MRISFEEKFQTDIIRVRIIKYDPGIARFKVKDFGTNKKLESRYSNRVVNSINGDILYQPEIIVMQEQ